MKRLLNTRWSVLAVLVFLGTAWGGAFLLLSMSFPVHYGPIEVEQPNGTPEETSRVVIRTFCSGCHQSGRSGVDFDEASLELSAMRLDRETWTKVVAMLRDKKMPPGRAPQPLEPDRQTLIRWLEEVVLVGEADPATHAFVSRRLQKSEYLNSMHELLGVRRRVNVELPADDPQWTACAEMPALPDDLAEKYRAAAGVVLETAFREMGQSEGAPTAALDLATACSCELAGEEKMDAVRDMLTAFARRAYRRPASTEEVDSLLSIFEAIEKDTSSFEQALSASLQEILSSPHFLCRLESRRPDATDGAGDQFELASRLSFFLWAGPPDEELLQSADKGLLHHELEKQTRRMLEHPRARTFAARLAESWFSFDKIQGADEQPDLVKAMREETIQFLTEIAQNDRRVHELISADYTYLNERLAVHYGIPNVQGEQMRRVSLSGTPRGGLLTHASVLSLSGRGGDDTSAVNRGKWVLENLLGQNVPRPPAGILEALKNTPKISEAGNVRQQTEAHRANPSCAQCHVKMDAIGLALENFDGRGAWRTELYGRPVDATGVLEDGEALRGPEELKAYLLRSPNLLFRGVSSKMLAFALARKLQPQELEQLDTIVEHAAKNGGHFSHVILGVVQSQAFLNGNRPSPNIVAERN